MNCLLLLIILFFCNGNSGCNSCNQARNNSGGCRSCMGNQNGNHCASRESNSGRSTGRNCDCDSPQANSCPLPPPPPTPRTQFPYLDMEPRTCGCEEDAAK